MITQYSLINDFEISDASMKLYKKYTNDDNDRMLIETKMKKELSMSQFSSCSIITYSKYDNNVFKLQNEPQKSFIAKFKAHQTPKVNPIDMNKDPIKQTSDETLSIYLKYLNCSIKGASNPSDKSIKLYETYCICENV